MISDLDDPTSLDPAIVGAKAAWLARGRQAGLPVLPGIVVHARAGRGAMALGAAMLPHGTGRARLAVAGMALDPELEAALPSAAAMVGPRLVVRSSSPLEGDGTWAGAFTSYLDVAVDELPTALRGCWASAFSNGTVERAESAGLDPGDLKVAVLIQPAIEADTGGTARVVADEVQMVAVRGSPAPLLQGWEPGVHGRVRSDGEIDGAALVDLLGAAAVREVTATLRSAESRVGASTCEWAFVGGRFTILQLGQDRWEECVTEVAPLPDTDADGVERLARIARAIRHTPGPLGEALVLPWALGEARIGTAGSPMHRIDTIAHSDVEIHRLDDAAALAEAVALAGSLTSAAWQVPANGNADPQAAAATALAALRGPQPMAAAATLTERPAPDPASAARLQGLLGRVRSGLVAAGAASSEEDAWYVTVDQAISAFDGRRVRSPVERPRLDPWMPFQAAVILATGEQRLGSPSGAGLGVGRITVVDHARRSTRVHGRDVILASRPLPHLAPLLWHAAAVVTAGGGPGAHLFESARALGLPAVSGIGVDDVLAPILAGTAGAWAIAVNGTTGTIAITPW